jgi:hypothetical protein
MELAIEHEESKNTQPTDQIVASYEEEVLNDLNDKERKVNKPHQ